MKIAKGTSEFLRDWFLSGVDNSDQDPNIGLVESLYQACSEALVYLWKTRFRLDSHTSSNRSLQKDVANIRLWEQNFPSGRLDHILGESSDLKINVLDNLVGIGNILALYFADSESTAQNVRDESDFNKAMITELQTQLEKARIILGAEERSDSSSEDGSSDDSSSATERQKNRFELLHCYISCLVELAPLIEEYSCNLRREMEQQPIPAGNLFRLSYGAQPLAMRILDRSVSPRNI
jgi:hypothetical protein